MHIDVMRNKRLIQENPEQQVQQNQITIIKIKKQVQRILPFLLTLFTKGISFSWSDELQGCFGNSNIGLSIIISSASPPGVMGIGDSTETAGGAKGNIYIVKTGFL